MRRWYDLYTRVNRISYQTDINGSVMIVTKVYLFLLNQLWNQLRRKWPMCSDWLIAKTVAQSKLFFDTLLRDLLYSQYKLWNNIQEFHLSVTGEMPRQLCRQKKYQVLPDNPMRQNIYRGPQLQYLELRVTSHTTTSAKRRGSQLSKYCSILGSFWKKVLFERSMFERMRFYCFWFGLYYDLIYLLCTTLMHYCKKRNTVE